MFKMSTSIKINIFIQSAQIAEVNIPIQELHTLEIIILWIAPESLCECYNRETASCQWREKDRMKESVSMRTVWVWVQTVSSLGERHSQQILVLLNAPHTHTHTQARCVANEPGVRLRRRARLAPRSDRWEFSQESPLSSPFLRLILRKQHVTVRCHYQSRCRLTWRTAFQSLSIVGDR